MKKTFFALFSVCVIAFSCKKNHDDDIVAPAKPYTNLANGTILRYRVVNDSGLVTQTVAFDTLTVNGDSTVNSKAYKIVVHSNGGVHSYYNNTGHDYYQFQQVAAIGASIEQLYLKDDQAQGGTWSQDITLTVTGLGDVPVHIAYTILETGISKTLNGVTYTDVVSVKTELSSSLLPGQISSDIKSYYARNVGLIEGNYNVDVAIAGIAIHTINLLQSADLH